MDISSRVGMANAVPAGNNSLSAPALNKLGALATDAYEFMDGKPLTEGTFADGLRDISPELYNQFAAITGKAYDSKGNKTFEY